MATPVTGSYARRLGILQELDAAKDATGKHRWVPMSGIDADRASSLEHLYQRDCIDRRYPDGTSKTVKQAVGKDAEYIYRVQAGNGYRDQLLRGEYG